MYQCQRCNFSTHYKWNFKRHQLVHSLPQEEGISQSTPHTGKGMSIQNAGTPSQAINLSNNINTLPVPQQIINISPPQYNPVKTTVDLDNNEYFDIRLKENFKILISGPSRSGKTFFVKDLVKNLDIFSKSKPQVVTLIYKVMQPIYDQLGVDYILQDCPNLQERLMEIANGRSMLCIFDDMMNSPNISVLANLFSVDGRHNNLSMIFISQKLFVNNDSFREISQNSDYFIIFKNPRNLTEIKHLSSQMSTHNQELNNYFKQATTNPFSYIMVNLTQECGFKVKYLSHLFNTPHTVITYFQNSSRTLIDGEKEGRTRFDRMVLASPHQQRTGEFTQDSHMNTRDTADAVVYDNQFSQTDGNLFKDQGVSTQTPARTPPSQLTDVTVQTDSTLPRDKAPQLTDVSMQTPPSQLSDVTAQTDSTLPRHKAPQLTDVTVQTCKLHRHNSAMLQHKQIHLYLETVLHKSVIYLKVQKMILCTLVC